MANVFLLLSLTLFQSELELGLLSKGDLREEKAVVVVCLLVIVAAFAAAS